MRSELRTFTEEIVSRRRTVRASPRTPPCLTARALLAAGFFVITIVAGQLAYATGDGRTTFKRIPTQFIAALGEPDAPLSNHRRGK